MNTRHIERTNAIAPAGRKSHLLRFGLGALLWLASFGGTVATSTADAADTGPMAPMATLAPAQPDSGSITIDPGKDVTLTAVEKIGDQGVPGQKVDWTVTGPDSASLTPTSSTTTARSVTSHAGLASTVFNAATAGNYQVTATTQKNPGCGTPSCATWVSTRFSVSVAAAGTTDTGSGSGGLSRTEALGLAAAVGAGALVAASNNSHNHNNQAPPTLTLASAGGTGQQAAANTPLTLPLQVVAQNGGANAASIAIQWSASNGVILSSSETFTNSSGVAAIQVLNVGRGPGPVTVTATRSDDPSATVSFTINILQPALTYVSGSGQSGVVNQQVPQPLVVEAELGANPQANVPILWVVSAGSAVVTSVSNGGASNAQGLSQATITFGPNPGPVSVTATRNDGSGVSQTFQLTSTPTHSLVIVSGTPQTVGPDKRVPLPLVVHAITNNQNAAHVTINWSASNGATLLASTSVTGLNGQASMTVTNSGTSLGPVMVTATRADDPTDSVQFTVNIIQPTLKSFSGNGQKGYIYTTALQPMVVQLLDGNGAPMVGQTVQWVLTGGSATTFPTSSVTNETGLASIGFTYPTTAQNITVVASAFNGTFTANFGEQAVAPTTLSITSGNNLNGAPGAQLNGLTVAIPPLAGSSLLGIPITFSIVPPGGATVLNPSTSTNAAGQASTNLQLGLTPMPQVQVLAQVAGGSPSATFNEKINGTVLQGVLTPISGNNLIITRGTPQQLVVRLTANGTPLAGQTITWSTANGTLSPSSTSTTGATGLATITVTPTTFGPFTVTASFASVAQYAGTSTNFSENTTAAVSSALTIISGNAQVITPNKPSLPLVVQLKGNGAPLAGQTITWSANTGTLSASALTDGSGKTSVTVTPTTAGPITVTASFAGYQQFTGAQVNFAENTTLATIPTLSSNAQSVGGALDSACAQLQSLSSRTSQQQDLLNQCLALNSSGSVSSGATATVVNQLTPTVAETQTQTATTANVAQFNNLSDRMTALRGGAQGVSLAGLSFIGPNGSLPLFDLGSTLLGATDNASKKDSSSGFGRWGFFMSGQIGRQEASAQSLTPAYNLDISGLTAGVDYRVNDGWVVGGAVGYSRQTTDLVGGAGNLSMTGWSLSGYATWYNKSDWYVDSSLTWSNNNFNSQRYIDYSLSLPGGGVETVDQDAQASSGGDTFAGSMTFGRDFHHQALAYGFYGKLQYSHQAFDAYQEQLNQSAPGSGLGLRVGERTDTSLDSVLGAKVDYNHSTNWGVLIPHAEIEWQHEFRPDPSNFQAFFIDDPTNTPIVIRGNPADDNYFRIGAGLSLVFTQGRSAFLLYDHTVGEQGITAYNVSLGFRMEF